MPTFQRAVPLFEGWYGKHQTRQGQTLALIPAFHRGPAGEHRGARHGSMPEDREGLTASLQVLTAERSWYLPYPARALRVSRLPLSVSLGDSRFTPRGVELHIEEEDLSLRGVLRYGPLTVLRSDIMGPFRFLAGMQCVHGVLSMGHSLEGQLTLNGAVLDFTGGRGYLETDRGRSFPARYLWTQSLWEGNSLMLAAATVPLPAGSFTGCICAIIHGGREFRLASYRGARLVSWSPRGAVVRQGPYRLEAALLEGRGRPLRAPVEGSMDRTVHESPEARVEYRFWRGRELLFHHTDPHAAFECAFDP